MGQSAKRLSFLLHCQGNGHPVAAVITTDAVAKQFLSTKVEYFNTFGGNPVSCAIASGMLNNLQDIQGSGCHFSKLLIESAIVLIEHTFDPSAVLDVIEDEKLTEHAKKVGQHLVDRLTKLQEKHKVK